MYKEAVSKSSNGFAYLFVLPCVLLSLLYATYYPLISDDLWIYLKFAQITEQTHHWVSTIQFAFGPIANKPYIAHSWLANFIYYHLLSPTWTMSTFAFARFGFLCLFMALVYCFSCDFVKDKKLALSLALLTVYMILFRSAWRPELLALFVSLLMVYIVAHLIQKTSVSKGVMVLALQCLWTNIHGSFFLGWFLVAWASLVVVEEHYLKHRMQLHFYRKAILFWSGLSVGTLLVSLVNPYGMALWKHCWYLVNAPFIRVYISEWAPFFSWDAGVGSMVMRLILIAVYVLVLVLHRRWMRPGLWLGCMALCIMLFLSYRNISFFGVLMLFPLWQVLPNNLVAWQKWQHQWFSGFLLVAILCVVYSHSNSIWDIMQRKDNPFYYFSKHAFRFIDHHVKGAVYNSQEVSGQLIYSFYPRIRVGIDGRVDLYGYEYFKFYNALLTLDQKSIDAFFNQHKIRFIILTSKNTVIWRTFASYHRMVEEGPWRLVYHDDFIQIWQR